MVSSRLSLVHKQSNLPLLVKSGSLLTECLCFQTLLPLTLGFVPDNLVAQAQAWLINDLETTRQMHLSTGATGTRLLFPYLSSIGRTDLAAEIAAQSTYPSHGYY